MTVRNLALVPATWDLQLAAGNLVLTADNAAIVQAANSALRTIAGEWFLDSTLGMPYLQIFSLKNPSLALIKQTLVDGLLGVRGISRVTQLDMQYVSAARSLKIAWTAIGDASQLLTSQVGVF